MLRIQNKLKDLYISSEIGLVIRVRTQLAFVLGKQSKFCIYGKLSNFL